MRELTRVLGRSSIDADGGRRSGFFQLGELAFGVSLRVFGYGKESLFLETEVRGHL